MDMKHNDFSDFNIVEMPWPPALVKRLEKQEPNLCAIIENINPNASFTVLKVSYPFGARIFDKGVFYLPTKSGDVMPLSDKRVPDSIKKQLGYSAFPFGMALSHGIEVYAELGDRIFSVAYFNEGLHLGIFETYVAASPFSVSAGAHSLLMVPKIANAGKYKNLKKYGVTIAPPLAPMEQFKTFVQIANHKNFPEPWTCEVLFFTAPWHQKMMTDKKWREFNCFLVHRTLDHARYARSKMLLDFLWEPFSRFLTSKRIKPNTYLTDVVKHLALVAAGILPAFSPSTDDQAAPISGLMKVYLEDYELRTYAPTFMQPHHFSPEGSGQPVYYAMQIPTYLESIPQHRTSVSTRADLVDLIQLMDMFIRELLHSKFHQGETSVIYEKLNNVQFDYFHSDPSLDEGIYPSSDLSKEDPRLMYVPNAREKREFCDTSSFARGCIRISKK